MTDNKNEIKQAAYGRYAALNGLNLYYEIHGQGHPLILLHGGLGLGAMFSEVLPLLAETRQVIAVDLQAHGRTADIDRPLRYESLADDIAALIQHLGHGKANVMGYSLGGGVALRTAVQYPQLVNKLVIVSAPHKRDGWYPEVLAGMGQMSGAAAEFMTETPMYQSYKAAAPKPENFPMLLDKAGEMLRQPYDWSEEVAALTVPVLLVYGDADSVSPAVAAQFFELLGGGLKDANWDRSGVSSAQLAILPNVTHYEIFNSPALVTAVRPFLNSA